MSVSDWGTYFTAKKAKLDEQLNSQGTDGSYPDLFRGITIYINGYTNPPDPELREIFRKHGGQYTQYVSSNTTFVIATNLPAAKKRQFSSKTLKPEWIMDSVKAGIKLDYRKYFLYDPIEESRQATLTQIQRTMKEGRTNRESEISADEEVETVGNEEECLSLPLYSDLGNSCDTLHQRKHYHTRRKNKATPSSKAVSAASCSNDELAQSDPIVPAQSSVMATTEEGFLESFYNKSRLHLISTMKKETQQLVAGWRKNSNTHKFCLRQKYLDEVRCTSSGTFDDEDEPLSNPISIQPASAVGRLTRPNLEGVAVAVTHSKGTGPGSKSEIACVSYEGRAKGVSAGMWLDEAKKLCPELQTIPYEFEKYKQISRTFFETVASLTLEIEPISCDELYVNAAEILKESRSSSLHLAQFIRDSVQSSAGIAASIGIGNSKLGARIATRLAKENKEGVHQLTEDQLKAYILRQPVRKLPGVGYATAEKLSDDYNIERCEDLQRMKLDELKQAFGSKNGEKLYWLCRGVDNDQVHTDATVYRAKSISAGCSFGVRFSTASEVSTFIKQLSSELSKRAAEVDCYGKKITLSLWVVRKGFIDVPVKPGAHGVVDIHSRTRALHIYSRDATIISKMSSELVRSVTKTSVPPNYIRGVRISLDSLRYADDMSEKEKRSVQATIDNTFAPTTKLPLKDVGSGGSTLDTMDGSDSILKRTSWPPTSDGEEHDDDGEDSEVTELIDEVSEEITASNISPAQTISLTEKDTKADNKTSPMENPERDQNLPFLNGVNSISKIKLLIRGGIASNHIPTDADSLTLTGYLKELIESRYLTQASELIIYLWHLIRELHVKKEYPSLAWATALIQVLKNLEELIHQNFGNQLLQ